MFMLFKIVVIYHELMSEGVAKNEKRGKYESYY